MLILGHTRFSLYSPGSAAWRATNGTKYRTEEEYLDYLYSDERLGPRTDIFLELTLPILKCGAGNVDYRHIISFSASLPEAYKARLREFADSNDFVVLDEQGTGEGFNPLTYGGRQIEPGEVFGLFRVDDDDLLSVSYLQKASAYVVPELTGFQVSFGAGFAGLWNRSGLSHVRKFYQPMNSMGLLSIFGKDSTGNLVGPSLVSHPLSDRSNPVVLDSREPAYLQARHAGQDSEVGKATGESAGDSILKAELDRLQTPENLQEFCSLFPGVRDKLTRSEAQLGLVFADDGEESSSSAAVTIAAQELKSKIDVPLPEPANSFSVAVQLECSPQTEHHNALWSLKLVDAQGNPIADGREIDSLARSARDDIGYFRYMDTSAGTQTNKTHFDLPSDVRCVAIEIVHWYPMESTIRVLKGSVFV